MSDTCYACGQDLPYDPEPPELSIALDDDKDAWQRRGSTWDSVAGYGDDYKSFSWKRLNDEHGPLKVVYTP